MPKILYFITQSEFGGAQRYVFDLANNLKADFQVAVALGEQGKDGKLAKILAENNIKYFIIPSLKRNISPINDLLAFFEIIKLIKTYQPDIIHLNSSKISILGSIASLFVKTKIIYTVHGWVFNEPLLACLKYFYLYAEKLTAGFKNKIICVSEYDKLVALKYKIAPAEKLVATHNGLAPINFYTKEEARENIRRLSFRPLGRNPLKPESSHLSDFSLRQAPFEMTKNQIIIGSIGNLYKTKGYEYLIEAANILIHPVKSSEVGAKQFNGVSNPPAGERLPLTFIIIGEGPERKNLENLIKKYNLENNFILTSQIDEANKLLKAFDIYVCSSVKEGLPYSILEAMAAGLPIVSTKVGGIPEMITNPSAGSGQESGLLVEPAKAQDLAKVLQKLISDRNLQIQLGENAKQNVSRNFGLEKMVEETRKVYLS